ncbi:MAG: hypothetical protein HYY34_00920 [Chloroflexi bacterium]|nr:hypothetical protein [Chloroflexota bacterium]
MLNKDTTVDARRRVLEKAYEDALRYALTYRTGWKDLETAAARLRAFRNEQASMTALAA